MTRLILRTLTHYWRTNLAVCLGVAAATAVLGGALIVGDSVRGSLRDLAMSRLGRTDYSITSTGYFREALAGEIASAGSVGTAPLVAVTGFVTHEPSGRRAANVFVYGVDERFWRFHGLEPREGVYVSPGLAAELGVSDGDVLLTRLQRPSDVPIESLFAHKEDVGRTVRLTVTATLPAAELGEFSLQPQQGEVRVILAPLRRLQRDLGVPDEINAVLIGGGEGRTADIDRAFRSTMQLSDLGVTVHEAGEGDALMLDTESGVIAEPLERAAAEAGQALGLSPMRVFTYLANTISVGERQVPYSLVSGLDLGALPAAPANIAASSGEGAADALVLNEWAARELGASVGDRAELEYYLWDPAGGLRTARSSFTVTGIVPMTGLAADRRLAPEYPGITGAGNLAEWDPPFPLDLSRVRPQDEQYWDDFRTTPKAFVRYERASELWSTRYGRLTGMRFEVPASQPSAALAESLRDRLRSTVQPASLGVVFVPTRELARQASSGATDFGEYFIYFSFFIVVSALILTILFFRLGVEQRLRQVGILRAAGYTSRHLRRMFLAEGALIAIAGSLVGVAGAVGYAHLIVHGLKTWWVGAVGTTLLTVHVQPVSVLIGAAGAVLAALACVLWSLRAVVRRSPRALLNAYSLDEPVVVDPRGATRRRRVAVAAAILGIALIAAGFASRSAQAGAFFGAGAALLTAFLAFLSSWLRSRDKRAIAGRGWMAVSKLGFRGAAFRPGRSVLSAALVASAAFIIVSVDAFRREGGGLTHDPKSGTGGYVLVARADVPLVHNPNEPGGRDALLVQAPELARARFSRFRLRPGDDASCLNLYRPGNPTIIAPEAEFVASNRFTFAGSLAESQEERANPWLLLERQFDDGAVPVIADATSLQYVLHASLGDTLAIDTGAERPLVLRFVGALRDSVLQGELVMGEAHFARLFPGHQGFRFFLIDAPDVTTPDQAAALAEVVERELRPFGVDAVSAPERLEAFHRVENTYLSTFQALGGLGLLLGTVGLATVMFRNVLERRRELALLRAVGYDKRHVSIMILAETILLLVAGLLAGTGCAIVAIAPAWLGRGGGAPGIGLALLLAGVIAAGLVSAMAATAAAAGGPLLRALRSE